MGEEERPRRPLLLPETYSRESNFDDWISHSETVASINEWDDAVKLNFDDWISHFETVASINEWDDAAKLKWLSVWLSGGAQTDFQKKREVLTQLPEKHYWNDSSHLRRKMNSSAEGNIKQKGGMILRIR